MNTKFNIPKGTKLIEKQRKDGSVEYTVRKDENHGGIEGTTNYVSYLFYLILFIALMAMVLN